MRIFILLFLLTNFVFLQGQSQGGDISIEGGLRYNKSISGGANSKLESSLFSLNPKLGFYIKSNHLIGLNFSYSQIKSKRGGTGFTTPSDFTSTENNYAFGVFYSAQPTLWKKLSLRTDGGFNFIKADRGSSNNPNQKLDIEGIEVYITPGLIYFITDKLAISAFYGNLSYVNQETTSSSNGVEFTDTFQRLTFDLSPSNLLLSLQFRIGTKKNPDSGSN